jgi:hypothetical protein
MNKKKCVDLREMNRSMDSSACPAQDTTSRMLLLSEAKICCGKMISSSSH